MVPISFTTPITPMVSPSNGLLAGVTNRSIKVPFRSIVISNCSPADDLITVTTSDQSSYERPFTLTILSPVFIPTTFAGEGTDCGEQTSVDVCGIHSLTRSTLLVREVIPTDENKAISSMKPKTKCRNEPAPKTINRWPTVAFINARSASSGDNSSRGVIPTILQYPPAGIAFKPNSVSPLVNDQIF